MLQVGDFVKIKKPEEIPNYNIMTSQYKEIIKRNQGVVLQIAECRQMLSSVFYCLHGLDSLWFFERELEKADAQIAPDEEFISIMF